MKKITLLTIILLIVSLTLCACVEHPEKPHEHSYEAGWTYDETNHWHKATCEHTTAVKGMAPHSYSNNKCSVCDYEKEVKPDPIPTPSKSAEEAIAEYLVSLGDNFTVSATVKITSPDNLFRTEEHNYKTLLDGNKIYADNDGELYYVEQDDDVVYLYSLDNETWHKTVATDEEYDGSMDIEEQLKEVLANVDWQSYNEEKGVAKGSVKLNNVDFWIECTLGEKNATITIVSMPLPVIAATINIFDIGTTTVTLPDNYVDDTVPPSIEPDIPNEMKKSHV
ncbi:MAG: hypothetical protein J1G02_04520 [Clostridiales bacterium]|nr:hypothetical protein [Clostridiales bacterium]